MMTERIALSEKLYLTINEVVELTGVPKNTVRALTRMKDCTFLLYPLKAGRTTMIKREAFIDFIENNSDILDELT